MGMCFVDVFRRVFELSEGGGMAAVHDGAVDCCALKSQSLRREWGMGTFSRLCAAVMMDEGEEFGVGFENRRIFK
jgi:hypothetical protein